MLLLKTCDQALKEMKYYSYITGTGITTIYIGLYFFFICSKGLLIWELAKQTAWQVRSHQATIFLIKVIIHLCGLVGWLGW